MTEHEQSNPLTDAELQRYTSYHERFAKALSLHRAIDESERLINAANRKPTEAEQEQLSELRMNRSSLALDHWEIDDCSKLSSRRRWPMKLMEFRCQVSFSAFADLKGALDTVLKEWWGKYNLPTLLEGYERAKEACSTHEARLKLARRKIDHAKNKLAQLEQDDSEFLRQLDPTDNLGEVRRAILCEIMGDVFSQFLRHVELDVIESKPDFTTEKLQAPFSKEPYDYIGIRRARTQDADLHDLHINSMIRAKGYTSWWDMQEKEPPRLMESGNGLQRFYYPRPYSEKYFWRFLHLLINTPLMDVKAALRNQFFGDQVDRDYVDGLLLHAEHNCHLTVDGAAVIADNEGVLAFQDPYSEWAFGTYPEGVESFGDCIFFGGEDFKRRAQLVREWCQEMALVDKEQPINAQYTPEEQVTSLPEASEESLKAALALPSLFMSNDEEPATKESILTDFQFENLTSAQCQTLCAAVGLDDQAQSYKPARAWGLAEVLVYYNFAAKGRTAELVQAIGKAYKIKMKENYAPDKLNQARKGARITTNKQLLLMEKINAESHDSLHKKQGKPQITRSSKG